MLFGGILSLASATSLSCCTPIGFNRKALLKFSNHRLEEIEKVEDIELIRSLNNGSLIFSPFSETTSFSIDTIEDLEKAKRILKGE